MDKPFVSVILPTFNRAHLILRAIRSVLSQTYRNIELIIVDDGSTDGTDNVVDTISDRRIKYVRFERNKGACVARNTGISIAKNDYIAFQDSDDEWHPAKLEKHMKVFEKSDSKVGVVYSGYFKITDHKRIYLPSKDIPQKDGNLSKVLGVNAVYKNFVTTSASVVRKSCFKRVGAFDPQLPRFQDWELWIRISKLYEFRYLDEPLVNVYDCRDRISRDSKAASLAFELILNKYFKEIARDPRLLGRYYFEIGTLLAIDGQIAKGKDYLKKAIETSPSNYKSLLSALIIFSSPALYAKATKIYLRNKD
jgi:glycosyltransferase involved in cell wall biosynthesis